MKTHRIIFPVLIALLSFVLGCTQRYHNKDLGFSYTPPRHWIADNSFFQGGFKTPDTSIDTASFHVMQMGSFTDIFPSFLNQMTQQTNITIVSSSDIITDKELKVRKLELTDNEFGVSNYMTCYFVPYQKHSLLFSCHSSTPDLKTTFDKVIRSVRLD